MNTPNPRAGHSAEAEGRKLAKEISGNEASRAASGKEKRTVDGEANAKGRELAQAVAGDTEARPANGDDSARREQIARAAYHKAEQRGFAPGGDVDDWISAERELNGQ